MTRNSVCLNFKWLPLNISRDRTKSRFILSEPLWFSHKISKHLTRTSATMVRKLIDYTQCRGGEEQGSSQPHQQHAPQPQSPSTERASVDLPKFSSIDKNVDWIQRSADHSDNEEERIDFQMKIVPKEQRNTNRRHIELRVQKQRSFNKKRSSNSIFQTIAGPRLSRGAQRSLSSA